MVACLALTMAMAGAPRAAAVVGLALVVAASLLLEVDLPWGARVPLGYAVVIAVAVLVEPSEALVVIGVILCVLVPHRSLVQLAPLAVGGAAAAVLRFALVQGIHPGTGDVDVLGQVVVIGGTFLLADLLLGNRDLRQVWSLYVTLLSAGALLAIAYANNPVLGLVAVVPLLVTKYSFDRLASARRTYSQTTRALSLLPEVAGLSPLGHGERTSVYAAALAAELGFDVPMAQKMATAARLHHIGHISLHEPEERNGPPDVDELRRVSGELLRETGFLSDVADLVEDAQEGGETTENPEAAIIRVCSTLDELVESGSFPDPFSAVLSHHVAGLERTTAIALLRLHDRRPELVEEARQASRELAMVAADAASPGHGHGHADDGHDCR